MNRYVRSLAIVLAGVLLAFLGVANAQKSGNDTETLQVTWTDAPGTIGESSASAGAQVVKDSDTGELRAARPGELPERAVGRPTEIINSGGGAIAVAGDDLMSESIAVRNADGSVTVKHNSDSKMQPEVK
jgi:hypothetical protein